VVGSLPEATYSLGIVPNSGSNSYYVAYTVNTSVVESNSTASFASVTGNTPINVNIAPMVTVPVNITNNTTEHMTLTFTNSGGSFTLTNIAGSGLAGYIPQGVYSVSVAPVGAVNTYPIIFSVGGSNQSNWTTVNYTSVTMNSSTAISMNPFPTEQVVVSNSTSQTIYLTFTDQVYGGVFPTWSIAPGASNSVPGYLPASTYKAVFAVAFPSNNYPIVFNMNSNTSSSTTGATWTGQNINSQVSIHITPVPLNQVVVTNTTNQTVTVTLTDLTYNGSYPPYAVAANTSNKVVASVPSSTYTFLLSNSAPASNYPIAWTLNGMLQTYYGPVAYGSVPVSSQVSIQAKPAITTVIGTNNTGKTIGLQFVNTVTGQDYILGLPTSSLNVSLGSIPQGTYNVFMNPPSPSSLQPISWYLGTATQTYYGEVEFGGVSITTSTISVQCYKDY
jgi:hypothetical protein